jgi:nucleoside-diphosphate-sugar epimerase
MRSIDLVFHQAAIAAQCVEDPLGLEVMVDGTFRRPRAADAGGRAKLVAASSASIYSTSGEYRSTSGIIRTAIALCRAAKLFSQACCGFHDTHGLDYVALRYFSVYGARRISPAPTPKCSSAGSRASPTAGTDHLRRRLADARPGPYDRRRGPTCQPRSR